jgi:toxin FitB
LIGWLLDTNVIAELINPAGERRVKAWASGQDERALFLSILTFGEFEKGVHNLPPDDPNRLRHTATRDSLAARFDTRVLPVSDSVILRWGAISGKVKRVRGHAPSVIDTLLAATALDHDLYLATRNIRDVRHCGAAVFNPWVDDSASFALKRRFRGGS